MRRKETGECLLNILNLRYLGIFGGSNGKESACNAGGSTLGGEDLLEKEMATHSSILA